MLEKLSQLYLRDKLDLISPKSLSKEEQEKSINSKLFLKDKRDLNVKVSLVASVNKQKGNFDRVEATSTTKTLESVLLTVTIDFHKESDVPTIVIPSAFVRTRIKHKEDCTVMHLRGNLTEIMVKVSPKIYTNYTAINLKGETILYACLLNTLYSILKAALLYCK